MKPMDHVAFLGRAAATLTLMSAGALALLLVVPLTAFRFPRLYREKIAGALGAWTLSLWNVRFVVHQEEPFPESQSVYISNHTSTIDMFVLIAMRLPNTRFFLSGYLRKLPPLALIGYLTGIFWTVPQSFPEKRTEIFKSAARTLRRSRESVYLSPEGERITTGEVGHFNKGAFHLATDLKLPIIPFFIAVPHAADPGKGLNARPGTVHVYVKPAIDTSQWRLEDLSANKERVRGMFIDWNREHRS
jgi:1-acyl-sn-glycerol-3-phosphate acyltransferase